MKNKIVFYHLFFCILILFSGCVFFRPGPEKLYKRALKNAPYDVIIVPGVPYDGKLWDRTMKGRVLWADYLYKKGITKNIIFSGAATYSPYVESRIMKLYAEQLGVPKEHIYTEEKALHSTENVYYSYHVAKELGFKKIAVATDPFQSKLLMGFSKRRFKMPVTHIPFVEDSLAAMDQRDPVIDASSAKVENFRSIIDSQSKWKRFLGTNGLNIHFEKE